MTRTHTALEMEAALCLWEAMIDSRMESTLPALESAFEGQGTGAMRHHAIALAPFVLATHDALPAAVRNAPLAYDYDIVPAILARIVWTDSGYSLPPVADAARDVAEALDSIVNMAPTPVQMPGPLAFMRAGDVFESKGDDGRAAGFYVVVDNVAGEADGPMTEAEAREHGDSFGEG